MSQTPRFAAILDQACRREEKYDWVAAVEAYKKALGVASRKDFLRIGGVHERIGYALYRIAMQSASNEDFKRKCAEGIEHYKRARTFYGKTARTADRAKISRCNSMIAYLGYWLVSDVPEKKRLLDECWIQVKDSLKGFEDAGSQVEYVRTLGQLSTSVYLAFCLDWDFQAREKIIREAVECGEKALKFQSSFERNHEKARAYVVTAGYLESLGFYFVDLDEREKCYQRALNYWVKANELSEETAYVELLNACGLAVWENPDWAYGGDQTLRGYRKALDYARRTGDKFIVGWALNWLAWHGLYNAETREDPDEMARSFREALQYAEDAKKQYSIISFTSPLWGSLWVEAPYAEYYYELATYTADPSVKRDMLEKAAEAAADYEERAVNSRYPEVVFYSHVVSSVILFSTAKLETRTVEKRQLLEKALFHRSEAVKIIEQFVPFFYWKRGLLQTVLGDIKSELAALTKDQEMRRKLLLEAMSDKASSVELGLRYVKFLERKGSVPSIYVNLGNWQYSYGDLLSYLYESSGDVAHLKKAVNAFDDAAESFQKLDLMHRVAECRWKMAQANDYLGDHLEAAGSFDLASESYKKAAERILPLKDFCLEHALYMQAWGEIEKAKYYHRKKEYDRASEHFEKAARMHESLKQLSYLAPNYWAWSHLEHAEELSREEESEEALQTFEQAVALFSQAGKSMQANLGMAQSSDEKQMTTRMLAVAVSRKEYGQARIAIEEAKILAKNGDHIASSEKFASAEEILQEACREMSGESRSEIQPIVHLCKAWGKMMMAEAKSSPKLFGEAARLFAQAREYMPDESTSFLTLGNSSLCKALKVGTEYEGSRNFKLYSAAKNHMDAAAHYYIKAGFKNGSEYVKATQRLFDAYMYLSKAQTETEPSARARYYQIAEKLLQVSAGSYLKAKYSERSELVRRLLESVKAEKQLALSLTEVLHVPAVSSTTASFSTPTPTYERAVGLEKFEHANIQAHLTALEEVTVGEEFGVQLDLVNAAKNFGLLVRVDNVVPPGFRVVRLPPQYEMQNGSLDLKGKKLEPLQVETLKIVVEPTDAGTAYLCPKVIFTDDTGNFKTCRSEAVQVDVHSPLVFKFKKEAARMAFNYLVEAFAEDYMKRRLVLQEAGWRSLVQIAKNSGVSLRSVYGDTRRRGVAISELERRGLIEMRVFPKSKGRGGRILKARISYTKETIKRYIDTKVAQGR